ncbi:hypothetical protein [uncultured Thiocystis sp.]|jgi:hypothetical protein|uniref:hypothetical protein n=1 Tax=uncultured Thiocystis sp. TaxID=1202134 RepID=UPI0025E936C8|nr:hypothetical protein [uncultured Thiocystis sp.]
MGALGILAAVAVLLGGVQTTMVMSEDDRLAAEATKEPVVEVQAVQSDTTKPFDLTEL